MQKKAVLLHTANSLLKVCQQPPPQQPQQYCMMMARDANLKMVLYAEILNIMFFDEIFVWEDHLDL